MLGEDGGGDGVDPHQALRKGRQTGLLRKLALGACDRELELLRSHPKDERGSVREIGLWDRMFATPHFLELSLMLWTELTYSYKWSFSGRLESPEMESFGDPKWSHLGSENELIWEPEKDPCEDRFGDRK